MCLGANWGGVAHALECTENDPVGWRSVMLASAWAFLQDPNNRAVIAWFGGGIVVVAGGIWAVVKFFSSRDKPKETKKKPKTQQQASSVSATHGGVAAGRDIRDASIDTGGRPKR